MRMRDRRVAVLARLALVVALAPTLPACSDCDLSVSTEALPDGVVGARYAAHLDSDCGGDVWGVPDGGLPPGIGLQDDGDINGIPTAAGMFNFTVAVYDFSSGETAYKGLAIRVDAGS